MEKKRTSLLSPSKKVWQLQAILDGLAQILAAWLNCLERGHSTRFPSLTWLEPWLSCQPAEKCQGPSVLLEAEERQRPSPARAGLVCCAVWTTNSRPVKAFSGRAGLARHVSLRGDGYINSKFAGKDSSSEKKCQVLVENDKCSINF